MTRSRLEIEHRRIRRWRVGKHADEQMDKRVDMSVKVGRLAVGKRKHERIGGPMCSRASGTWLSERTDGWWMARRVGGGSACKAAGRHLAVGKGEQACLLVGKMRRVWLMDGMVG